MSMKIVTYNDMYGGDKDPRATNEATRRRMKQELYTQGSQDERVNERMSNYYYKMEYGMLYDEKGCMAKKVLHDFHEETFDFA